jgi:hypothetical protein
VESIVWRAFAFLWVASLTGCYEQRPFAEQYPGPWKDDVKIELVKLLIAQHAQGCGELWWRTRDGKTGKFAEYLVYCTSDGKEWTAWLLWPGINSATGPSGISDGPPPPH